MGAYAIDEESKNKRPVYTKEESGAMIRGNLLANGDFQVNTNGESSYTASGSWVETVNRWRISDCTVTVNADGTITIQNTKSITTIFQQVLNEALTEGMYTLSCEVVSVSGTVNLNANFGGKERVSVGLNNFAFQGGGIDNISIELVGASSVTLKYIRLDVGDVVVPHMKEDYEVASLRCGQNKKFIFQFFNHLEALGLSQGCSAIDVVRALPVNSILLFELVYNGGWITSGMPDGYTNGGLLEVIHLGVRYIIRFTRQNQNTIATPELYLGSVASSNPTEITWKKVTTA